MNLLDRWVQGWGIILRMLLLAIAVGVLLLPLYLLHLFSRPDYSEVIGFGLLYLFLVFPTLLPSAMETCGLRSDLIGSLSQEEYARDSSATGRSGGGRDA